MAKINSPSATRRSTGEIPTPATVPNGSGIEPEGSSSDELRLTPLTPAWAAPTALPPAALSPSPVAAAPLPVSPGEVPDDVADRWP